MGCRLLTESTVAAVSSEGVDLLTLKAPPIICSRRQFQILVRFQKYQIRHYISRELCLLADNSHEISFLKFVKNKERCHIMCRLLQL